MLFIIYVVYIFLQVRVSFCNQVGLCDRRPLGTNADPLPPDNRFQIEIKNIRENKYIPMNQYEVRLFSRDEESPFIAFTISIKGESVYNKDNPRRPLLLQAGSLALHPDYNNTKFSEGCNNTIIQSDITPKKDIKVLWTAPVKDNQCVTIFAVVAVLPDVWYSYEGPLSRKVCEDRRKADDMLPMENDNCQVCEDARYQLTFEGMWSSNTHDEWMYPKTEDVARFGDIVGASHSKDITVYKYNFEATEGLQMLAQQGNTTILELEILASLSLDPEKSNVRTLIKATAPAHTNETTVTNFRVTRRHHLVSVVTAILPSPDWFLGVSNLELCVFNSNKWADDVIINLYPLDAGTDSGKTFESANEPTSPAQPITTAEIVKNIADEDKKPFARLLFHLMRTYTTPDCIDQDTTTDTQGGFDDDDTTKDEDSDIVVTTRPRYRPTSPTTTTTTSEEPPVADPETQSDCPMTTWSEWEPCNGECIQKSVEGYQARYRQHIAVPTDECAKKMPTEDFQPCVDECEDEIEDTEEEGDDEK